MNITTSKLRGLGALAGIALLMLGLSFVAPASADDPEDSLYISDGFDDTVKRFDARTGAYLGDFVAHGSGGLNGPRGLIFKHSKLIVANQNVDQNFAGEILRYRSDNGNFLSALVPCNPPLSRNCDPNAPFAPRGIIRGPGNILFVADHDGGRVAKYNLDSGAFLGNLDTSGFTGPFFPRGIVKGPDDLIYVSVTALLVGDPLAGSILRFNAQTGKFVDVFTSNLAPGCAAHLHRPEGLVFGPNDKLYVTSFRADANDNDKILVFNRRGQCLQNDQINLDKVGEPRTFAQSAVFGPKGKLFVPINNTGEVRRYNVKTKQYDIFIAAGGELQIPWFLTFGETDPSTLEYDD